LAFDPLIDGNRFKPHFFDMSTSTFRQIAVLGATGSIGRSALDVIARHPGRMRASVLTAGQNVDELIAMCHTHKPDHAVIANPDLYSRLNEGVCGLPTTPHAGMDAIDSLASSPACNTVIAAIVGAAGLSSTLAATESGKRLLLANKESLVLAGELLMAGARRAGAEIIPIDSEHNAIFQCLHGRPPLTDLNRITLTASGGPFRGRTRTELTAIRPEQAIAHPTWSMGPKISIDSATLMNKGLELIEAHHLFGLPSAQLDVLVHPQSLIHALVEFIDGSTLAQLGLPDMRTALSVGLGWPERIESGVNRLDLLAHPRLEFESPDFETFPALALARQALETGGTAPAILNAANEIAVTAFLERRIGFLSIPALVDNTLCALTTEPATSLAVLDEADAAARRHAKRLLDEMSD